MILIPLFLICDLRPMQAAHRIPESHSHREDRPNARIDQERLAWLVDPDLANNHAWGRIRRVVA